MKIHAQDLIRIVFEYKIVKDLLNMLWSLDMKNIMLGNINQNPIAKQLKIIFIFLIWFNIN